jgi:hypothetical protein
MLEETIHVILFKDRRHFAHPFIGNSAKERSLRMLNSEPIMKRLSAAIFVCFLVFGAGRTFAKDTCTHTWVKGNYKTFRQVEAELRAKLSDAKILRFSLCRSEKEHYFQVTILQAVGKVLVIRLPAR